jgi:hypothetical protein
MGPSQGAMGAYKTVRELQDGIVVAERLLLYTISFDMLVTHPYDFCMQRLESLRKYMSDRLLRDTHMTASTLINDSFVSTLCIDYDYRDIGNAALLLAFTVQGILPKRYIGGSSSGNSSSSRNSAQQSFNWATLLEIKAETIEPICQRMIKLYSDLKVIRKQTVAVAGLTKTPGALRISGVPCSVPRNERGLGLGGSGTNSNSNSNGSIGSGAGAGAGSVTVRRGVTAKGGINGSGWGAGSSSSGWGIGGVG